MLYSGISRGIAWIQV